MRVDEKWARTVDWCVAMGYSPDDVADAVCENQTRTKQIELPLKTKKDESNEHFQLTQLPFCF